jgi:hypothetical protein
MEEDLFFDLAFLQTTPQKMGENQMFLVILVQVSYRVRVLNPEKSSYFRETDLR